jgi:hypothetical protein
MRSGQASQLSQYFFSFFSASYTQSLHQKSNGVWGKRKHKTPEDGKLRIFSLLN